MPPIGHSEIVREVQSVLTPDLLQPRYRRPDRTLNGYCYCGAEAVYYLAGARESGLQPVQLSYHGTSHWWLVSPDGSRIDVTLLPDEDDDEYPYHLGTPRKFYIVNGGPSRRAKEVMRRVGQRRRELGPSAQARA